MNKIYFKGNGHYKKVVRTNCYIGKANHPDRPLLDAHLDDLKIFSRALDQTEIQKEMNIRRPLLN